MKNLYFSFSGRTRQRAFRFLLIFAIIAFFSLSLTAQSWILQRAEGVPNSVDPNLGFSSVSDQICWGFNRINSQYIRTTDGGENWTVSDITGATGLKGTCISALDSSTAWIAMIDPSNNTSGGIFKTFDGGAGWVKQATAFPGTGGHPKLVHFFDAYNGVCVGDPRDGYWEIYTTTNGGSSWIRVGSDNIPPPVPANEFMGPAYEAESHGNALWFGTYNGTLYRTTDRGYTWSVTRNILNNGDGFSFAFKDSQNGLACTFVNGKKLSRTTDGGATWTGILPLPTGLSGLSPYHIAHVSGSPGSYVITSNFNYGGINDAVPGSAYSSNNGDNWTQFDDLPTGPASFSSTNAGWCSGINDSIYKWTNIFTSVNEIDRLAEGGKLGQNHPNPFSTSTKIPFSITNTDRSQEVSLVVFDAAGKPVARVLDRQLPPGNYEVDFDATNLPGGVYYYKLVSGQFTLTRQMSLIK